MSKMLFALAVAATLSLSAAPIPAAERKPAPDVQERAEEALKEGAEKIMRALDLIMRAVPQYDLPEMLENGDIIIRRRRPDPPARPKPPEGVDETAT